MNRKKLETIAIGAATGGVVVALGTLLPGFAGLFAGIAAGYFSSGYALKNEGPPASLGTLGRWLGGYLGGLILINALTAAATADAVPSVAQPAAPQPAVASAQLSSRQVLTRSFTEATHGAHAVTSPVVSYAPAYTL